MAPRPYACVLARQVASSGAGEASSGASGLRLRNPPHLKFATARAVEEGKCNGDDEIDRPM